jgi:hypothetical protein
MKIVKVWTREEIIANLQAYAALNVPAYTTGDKEQIKYDDYKVTPGAVPYYWLKKIMKGFTPACVAAGLRDKVRKPAHSKLPAHEQDYASPYRLGEAKMRRCLLCDQMFPSRWAGNRFCIPCASIKAHDVAMMQAGFEECA